MRILRLWIPFTLFLLFSSCSSTPVTGNKALLLIPEGEELAMGMQAWNDIKSKERETRNTRLKSMVAEVGRNISAVANRADFQWEVRTFESTTPNAFCLPGGKIGIYTGILPYAQNEAGLAAVMGHEVGHAIARHGGQRMSQQLVTNIGMVALGVAAFSKMEPGKRNLLMAAIGAGVTVGVMLPYSRSHELEADEIGLVLMAQAGYDPREAVRFWERFSQAGGKAPPEFLSTHPNSSKRAEKLRAMLPQAMEIYQRAPRKIGLGNNF
ncbi:MAG: M48 family peptidase [Deltaproteobacteria bacterium]|jgi:metalloendopeptidase OMA1, mitochondrial|nr:MAG: M48 family peptidase [Deltaproteobacteria bacterium]